MNLDNLLRYCLNISDKCPIPTVTFMSSLPTASNPPTVPNHVRRTNDIRAEYNRQKARGTRSDFIIADLAYRYFLTESTIESIVWKRGRYRVSTTRKMT